MNNSIQSAKLATQWLSSRTNFSPTVSPLDEPPRSSINLLHEKPIWQFMAKIGPMTVVYYLYKAKKYDRQAKQLKSNTDKFMQTS